MSDQPPEDYDIRFMTKLNEWVAHVEAAISDYRETHIWFVDAHNPQDKRPKWLVSGHGLLKFGEVPTCDSKRGQYPATFWLSVGCIIGAAHAGLVDPNDLIESVRGWRESWKKGVVVPDTLPKEIG